MAAASRFSAISSCSVPRASTVGIVSPGKYRGTRHRKDGGHLAQRREFESILLSSPSPAVARCCSCALHSSSSSSSSSSGSASCVPSSCGSSRCSLRGCPGGRHVRAGSSRRRVRAEGDAAGDGKAGDDADGSSEGGGGFSVEDGLQRVLQSASSQKFLDGLAEKVLQNEESAALLKDFASAAERVAMAQQELESIDRREKQLAERGARLAKAIDEEVAIAALVEDMQRDVLEAEEEMKAAELALVVARAGGSIGDLDGKWASGDIDDDLERKESGKAAAVSALAGTLANVPFLITGRELGIGTLLSAGGVIVSCALFGLTYRYILRRDLGNIQLKSGAAAAFAVVRGIGQVDAIQLQVGFPAKGLDDVLAAALNASEGLFIFGFASLALDFCLREGILSPFPSKKS